MTRMRRQDIGSAKNLIILISLLLLISFLQAEEPSSLQSSEYEVKAAFIYNFVKFIQWPLESEQTASDSIKIGILGNDPFGYIMEKVIGGKHVGGKTISIQRFKEMDQCCQCHVLFISISEKQDLKPILSKCSNSHVLTVSEMEDFAELGGMIYLYMENQRIRFAINTGSARQAGLKISSKLLKLANVVHSPEDSENTKQ